MRAALVALNLAVAVASAGLFAYTFLARLHRIGRFVPLAPAGGATSYTGGEPLVSRREGDAP